MSAHRGRTNTSWTLSAGEELVLKTLRDSPHGLTDAEVSDAIDMPVTGVQRYRVKLVARGLIRSYSTKKIQRYIKGLCPECGKQIQLPIGVHMGVKVWRPVGDALRRSDESGQADVV